MADSTAPTLPPYRPPSTPPPRLTGPAATIVALVTALGGLLATWQTFEDGRATSRAAYDALKAASEQQAAQLAAQLRGQDELRAWVQELSERLERRQANTEKVLRKVKPIVVATPVEPAPKAPPAPSVTPPAPLPRFDSLEK